MKKSDFHKLIREVHQEVVLEEGILDFVFNIANSVAAALIDKHRDYLLRNLKDDPEIKAMQRDVGISRNKMIQAFTDRYKSNKTFKNKVDGLIRKIK